MHKAHDVRNVSVSGCLLHLEVDGTSYGIDLTEQSHRLARATQSQRERVEVSPSGYGLHWPPAGLRNPSLYQEPVRPGLPLIRNYTAAGSDRGSRGSTT